MIEARNRTIPGAKLTRRSEHVADGLGDHGGVFVDDELEALGADQLHCVFLPHRSQTHRTRSPIRTRERERFGNFWAVKKKSESELLPLPFSFSFSFSFFIGQIAK